MKSHTVTVAEFATGILLSPTPPHPRVLAAVSEAEYAVSFASIEESAAFVTRILSARGDIEAWVRTKDSEGSIRFYVENGIIMKQSTK